ncbi:MAG: Cullin-3 [Thelocarpon superellum]|nr:MAG: Cullin-3 [Thelocarpon superellum]
MDCIVTTLLSLPPISASAYHPDSMHDTCPDIVDPVLRKRWLRLEWRWMQARTGRRRMMLTTSAKQGLTSPADNVDFETMWSVLAAAFREIHTKNASKLSFEENYRIAYKLVLKKKGDDLYEHVKEFERAWLSGEVRETIKVLLAGKVLTGAGAIGGTTANERRTAGEKFLKGLKEAWEDHNLCVNMTTDVLMYMDRVYCADTRRPSIFTTSMGLFRDHILRAPLWMNEDQSVSVASILNAVILDQIQMEREGDIIDKNRIRSCIYMLEGLYETDDEDEQEKLYLTSFEEGFLEHSRRFYAREGQAQLRTSDAGAYLRHTANRLVEEADRCQSTVSPLTAPKIHRVVEEELITRYLREVAELEGSGVKYMLDNDRYDDLALFYQLNSRVDPTKDDLSKPVQQRVVQLGHDINAAVTALTAPAAIPAVAAAETGEAEGGKTSAAPTVNQQTVAAIKWVEDVLRLKDKYDAIWERSFASDQGLQTSLTRSFSDFINVFARSSEYISLFIDDNLRRGLKGKTENEVDVVLEKAIVLLRYVRDKDLFERYYKKHLSRRLLNGKSISADVEKQMIMRMKMEVGNHFTQKLEGMFKDMTVSEDLTAGFKTLVSHLERSEAKQLELAATVLTSTFWPLESMGTSSGETGGKATCVFPTEIEKMKSGFEKFYLGKHTGRKLTWQANMGTADLRVVFPKIRGREGVLSKERRHELNVSTYAMVVLMLFNAVPSGASLTFEEIQAQTMIPTNELIRNLQSLALVAKTRILLKEPMSKDVKPTDRFSFNDAFSSKFLKLKVGVVAGGNKVEGDKERKDTEKKNDEMRKGVIEAAIVRIMKQRKVLAHQNLYTEVIAQLSSRFKPDINMVKTRVEGLIEREYLERVDDTRGGDLVGRAAYRYLA